MIFILVNVTILIHRHPNRFIIKINILNKTKYLLGDQVLEKCIQLSPEPKNFFFSDICLYILWYFLNISNEPLR